MAMTIYDAAAVLAAYLLGAVPFGLLIAKSQGVDIRQYGSRNIGATNVMRVLGRKAGFTTFGLDALKGFVPAFLFARAMARFAPGGLDVLMLSIACGVAAILGHNFPVYLRFKGGKGVATSAGVLIGIAPLAAAIGMAAWGLCFLFFHYVSLASILAALVVGIAGWFLYGQENLVLPSVLSLLVFLVILRHRGNMLRLLQGTENGFHKKPES